MATYSFLVLAKGGMDDAHVEENFGCVCNVVEILQCIVELIVVVPRQGGHPGLYFLAPMSGLRMLYANTVRHTCFNDMAQLLLVSGKIAGRSHAES